MSRQWKKKKKKNSNTYKECLKIHARINKSETLYKNKYKYFLPEEKLVSTVYEYIHTYTYIKLNMQCGKIFASLEHVSREGIILKKKIYKIRKRKKKRTTKWQNHLFYYISSLLYTHMPTNA